LNPRPPGCSTEGVAPLHTAPLVPVTFIGGGGGRARGRGRAWRGERENKFVLALNAAMCM
jgi:hypothetical protein